MNGRRTVKSWPTARFSRRCGNRRARNGSRLVSKCPADVHLSINCRAVSDHARNDARHVALRRGHAARTGQPPPPPRFTARRRPLKAAYRGGVMSRGRATWTDGQVVMDSPENRENYLLADAIRRGRAWQFVYTCRIPVLHGLCRNTCRYDTGHSSDMARAGSWRMCVDGWLRFKLFMSDPPTNKLRGIAGARKRLVCAACKLTHALLSALISNEPCVRRVCENRCIHFRPIGCVYVCGAIVGFAQLITCKQHLTK